MSEDNKEKDIEKRRNIILTIVQGIIKFFAGFFDIFFKFMTWVITR